MSGHSPVLSQPISEFLVQKSRVEATLTLSNGAVVRGCFFISSHSRTHAGPEGVGDLLNSESGFFPFEARRPDGVGTILYNRDHLIFAALDGADEPRRAPDYDLATKRSVTMLMSNGARLYGTVRVYYPKGHDRLSDFARGAETFRYLESDNATYIINVHHLVELEEETPVP